MRLILSIILGLSLISSAQAQNTQVKIGDTIPDFSFQGQFAKSYHLKELKGSYVLLHFWASWNEESRKMQRDYVDTYARFKDRKFKNGRKFYIIGISLDESKKHWELALKKDNLPWKNHVCDQLVWNSPLLATCKVSTIPFNLLLDPNGRVIAINVLPEKLSELLQGL